MRRIFFLLLFPPFFALADAPVDAPENIRIGPPTGGLVNGVVRFLLPPTVLSSSTNAGIRQSGGFGWLGDFVSTGMASITFSIGNNTSRFYLDAPDHVPFFGIYKTTDSTGDKILTGTANGAFLYTGIGLSTAAISNTGAGAPETLGTQIIGHAIGTATYSTAHSTITLDTGLADLMALPKTADANLIFISSPFNFSRQISSVLGPASATISGTFPISASAVPYVIFPVFKGIQTSSNPITISGAQMGDDFAIFIETSGFIFTDNSSNIFARGKIKRFDRFPSASVVDSISYKNRVFVLTKNNRLEWSGVVNVSSFPAVNFQRVNDANASRPLALLQYRGALTVINERSIILIQGENFDTALPDWTVSEIPLPSDMRLVSSSANVVHKNIIFCAEKKGIVIFDGSSWRRLFGNLLAGSFENTFGQGLVASFEDVAGGQRRHSMVSSAGSLYGSLTVMTSGTTNFTALNFMVDNNDRFWLRDNPNRITSVNKFETPMVLQNDRLVALIQDTTSFYAMQWSADPTIGRSTGTDFSFNATFAPVPNDDTATQKHFLYAIPVFSTEGSSVTFSYKIDDGTFKNTTIFPPSGAGLLHRSRVDINEVGTFIEFKIEQAAAAGKFTDRNFRFLNLVLFYKTREPTGDK